MKTIGIIAEYNPFHNGHLYQIQKIKKLTGAQNIVVAMSGNFVQRGAPAWTDKYLRTQMALEAGVDFVFELPVSFAASSAETFALAGVSLLSSLGFVDGICFGSECGEISLLNKIAHFLVQPPEDFYGQLKKLVSQGLSFPSARQKALSQYFAKECEADPTLLSSPNNILAIEYLKAIHLLNSHLVPYTLKRNDLGYHSENFLDTQTFGKDTSTTLASATAIRKQSESLDAAFFTRVQKALPENVFQLLKQQKNRFPLFENDFSSLLYYCLNTLTETDLKILDMTPELYHRIKNCLTDFTSYSEFISLLKTKQYTYSRISRVLLHTLLNIYNLPLLAQTNQLTDTPLSGMNNNHTPLVPYARLLGFSKEKSPLLRIEGSIPIITKPADGTQQIKTFYSIEKENYINYACELYEKDIFAANLYTHVQNEKLKTSRSNEYYQKPIII